jgi:hypothetical protein
MRIRTIFRLWLPLAISFELMMLEGPAVQAAIGRLPNPQLNLAAWGLTMSLALLLESPIIMLLATSIALVRDGDSYRALRQFVLCVCGVCTVGVAALAFTPLFHLVARHLMGQPEPIVAMSRPALGIMLFWPAAIGWRRFCQGPLVGHGQTRMVSWGTAIRLTSAVAVAFALAAWGRLPGVEVGACVVMVAVAVEAVATTVFVRPIVKRDLLPRAPIGEPLTQRSILQFHAPLAATTLLTLLAQPMTSAALARLAAPQSTLAAWPVTFMVLLVIRGWGLALQEITVAQARDPQAQPVLWRFAWMVGGVSSGAVLLLAATPLLHLYYTGVLHLPATLQPYATLGVAACLPLPLFTALGSWARGVLVARGESRAAYRGMGVNLATHAGLLGLGVAFQLPGMWVAAIAFCSAAATETLFLIRRIGAGPVLDSVASVVASPVVAVTASRESA